MSVSHGSPGGDKRVLPQNLIQALEVVWGEALAASTLTALVVVVLKGVRRLGVATIEHVLETRDHALRTTALRCPKCAAVMRRDKNRRQVTRMTLLGKVTYRRTACCCRECGHREFPLDERLSLKELLRGHSDEFAHDVVLFCTIMPFGKGCELFTRCYGFVVSTRLARALTLAVGTCLYETEMARAKKLWALREQQPELFLPLPAELRRLQRHQRVYVMMDNSKLGFQEGKRGRGAPSLKTLRKLAQAAKRKAVRAAKRHTPGPVPVPVMPDEAAFTGEEGWKDVRALLVFREEDLAQTSKHRREILHRRVLAHVGTHADWLQLVHLVFHEEGVYTAHEVIVVADGGSGIWEMVAELLPKASFRTVIEVLDWCHAASHLWTVGRALKGCKTEAQRKACIAWVMPLLDDIFDGKVANVLQRLRKLTAPSATAADEVRKCIDYFTDHQARMRYTWFRKHGYLIGSGAVESVHNWVIQARCRLPGMRWSEAGVNAILRLRCAWASGRFDETFAQAARHAVPPEPLSDRERLEAA